VIAARFEAAVFRPQIGYYNSVEEEAAALMESLANNHGFIDGNKRIAFAGADVFLWRNGSFLEVGADEAYDFIAGSMERQQFRFPRIVRCIQQHAKPLR
jgi:death on curing protein